MTRYNIPSFLSIPEKTELATQILLPSENDPGFPTLSISFFSAASIPLAFPPTIARGFGWPKLGLGVEGGHADVSEEQCEKVWASGLVVELLFLPYAGLRDYVSATSHPIRWA